MLAPDMTFQLVDKFATPLVSQRSPENNESQALCSNVYNNQGYAYAFEGVIYEDFIKLAGTIKAPDYTIGFIPICTVFIEFNLKQIVRLRLAIRKHAFGGIVKVSVINILVALASNYLWMYKKIWNCGEDDLYD
jgi:hypothetical protein